jgi:hypothetical protein
MAGHTLLSCQLFLASVPGLWLALRAAAIMLALSVFAFAPVLVFLAKKAIE